MCVARVYWDRIFAHSRCWTTRRSITSPQAEIFPASADLGKAVSAAHTPRVSVKTQVSRRINLESQFPNPSNDPPENLLTEDCRTGRRCLPLQRKETSNSGSSSFEQSYNQRVLQLDLCLNVPLSAWGISESHVSRMSGISAL